MPTYRLLLISSERQTTAMFKIYLTQAGYSVQVIDNAEEAINQARTWQPNAIIISDQIAGQPAGDVCHNLLSHDMTAHIPVILLVRSSDRQSRLNALELGVHDIVIHPYDIEELKLRVEGAIRLAAHRHDDNH